MKTILKALGQELYSLDNHCGYLIQWNMLAPLCKKWSRNRDSDMGRVQEMFEFVNKSGYIPRMIHLAHIPEEGLVCYDGNHRREVFNLMMQEQTDLTCVVDVIYNATQNEVYKAFSNINKSVQLPAIYLEDTSNSHMNKVKDDIIQLVKTYEHKYKAFLSTSGRCHAPNFNRDTFIDNITNIYHSFNGTILIKDLARIFDALNREYAKENMCRPHSQYKPHVIEKCKKHDFWLFLDRTIPIEHVERLSTTSP